MSKWIKCSDSLPTKDAAYIIYAPTADAASPLVAIAWYDPTPGDIDARPVGWSLLPEVFCDSITHWMPLPEGPEGE